MRLRRANAVTFGTLLIAVLAIAACSGGAARPATDVSVGGGTGSSVNAPTKDGATVGEAAPAAGPIGGQDADGGNPGALVDGALIVRTGSLELEVIDFDATLLRARAAIIGLGGYVSDSQRANSGESSFALVTYRIPSDRWDDALDALHGLAQKVVAENTKSAEVTGQVVDLDARIANLRTTETALQGIMARATKITDVLEVQNQLTAVQGQIEQLVAQRAHLADQAAMGTLAVTFSLPVAFIADATSGWDLGAEFDRAVAALLVLGQGIVTAGLWIAIVVVPIGLGFAIAIALALFLARRLGALRRPTATSTPTATET